MKSKERRYPTARVPPHPGQYRLNRFWKTQLDFSPFFISSIGLKTIQKRDVKISISEFIIMNIKSAFFLGFVTPSPPFCLFNIITK